MALTGTFNRTLDEKQRLAIPKPLRDAFGESDGGFSLYIAPGNDQSLSLYSDVGFQALADRFENQSRGKPEIRNYLRLFYARTERVGVDSQGRIRIPERLVELAGLKHEVVVLGVQDHAELWERSVWEEFLTRHEPSFDEMAARALDWSG